MSTDEIKDWIDANLEDYVPPPSGTFSKWMFPVIPNMAHHDIINQLVAVQPMTGPAAGVFYADFVHKLPWWKRLWKAIIAKVAQK